MPTLNTWNAPSYHKHANFVSDLALPVVDLLAPQKEELILDLGCGDGSLAIQIAKQGAEVIGVDNSRSMVQECKHKGIESYMIDATQLPYTNKFDAVFSNAVLHWVEDQSLALKKIHRALKDQGRFIAEFGGYGNINILTTAIKEVFDNNPDFGSFKNPWFFPTPLEYEDLLKSHGFTVHSINLIPRPTKIDDISNWLTIFANGIVSHLSPSQQVTFKEEVKNLLKPKLFTQEDGWVADYVRLRLKATKT